MSEWITCPQCKSIVPHLEHCDKCMFQFPTFEIKTSDNTSDYKEYDEKQEGNL